ncbi:hypothetical protein [Streptacidiphilus anmyonensis]|uniref:hypothetical protein n=1 Tax=Streptacidiphilus anmyonensis TaxID=405782 RepID=UPI000B306D82|nr:hypothetical protein [Streptacidiphilus anmyonensis]
MVSVRVPMVWHVDGQMLVPAAVLSDLLRQVAGQLATWPDEGADPGTVRAVLVLLRQVADQIDVDCIEVVTALDEEEER